MQTGSFNKLFKTAKPVIGAVHLKPLPGSPKWGGSMEKILAAALADSETLVKGGSDGFIVENFGDAPFFKESVPPHTVAAMTAVVTKIRERFPNVPLGVNVLRNDAPAALGIAMVCGADFIRVNVHTGVYTTDQGFIEGRAAETLRLRTHLRSKVLIFADVNVKHASPLDRREIGEIAEEAVGRGLADAIIITGEATGEAASSAEVQRVTSVLKYPVIVGSGITPEDISMYASADGYIVGTYLKRGGDIAAPVDIERVRSLVKVLRKLRRGS